jgi:hypothetical protein
MHEPFEGLADGDAQLLRGLLEHHGNTRSVVVIASPVLASSPASQSIPVWKTANSSDEDKAPHQNSGDDQRTPVIIAELPPLGANSTIGEWLGLTPLVIRRYAMSIGAKIAGISERDFKRRNGKRPNRYTCTECDGLGFILRAAKPLAGSPHYFSEQICKGCNGAAFLPPVSEVTFKERTLAEFQQQPIGTVLDSIKSLPRVADGVAALELLSLTDLPLLLPLELVSPSERIRLMLVKALFDAPQPEVSSAPPKIGNTSKGKIRAIIKAPIARGSLVEADLERISRLVAFSLTNGIQVRIGLDDSW